MLVSLPNRVLGLIESLSHGLIEREQHVKLMLLAALAGEHVLLIGPPGTAKSLLARRLRLAFRDATFFERLLTQFSIPEDLFGPYSLEDLDHGRYRRLTEGYLPEADVGFLDEIFKANPSILNALLTILNERVFHNVLPEGNAKNTTSRAPQPLPILLKCLVGASNEVPPPGELDALYDRFLIRCEVGPVDDFIVLLQSGSEDEPEIDASLAFSSSELDAIRKAAERVTVPDQVDKLLALLRQRVAEVQLDVSDRRWLKIRKLLQAAAHLNGRKAVSPLDVMLVPHCVWSPRQDQPQPVPLSAKKDDGQKPPSTPVEVRDGLTAWLHERLWEPAPAKPGLLGDQVTVWEQKLQTLAKQAAKNRDASVIASDVRETESLQKRTTESVKALTAEWKAFNVSAVLRSSPPANVPNAKLRDQCAAACEAATRWLPPSETLTALRHLEGALRQVTDWNDRSTAAHKTFQQLQKDAAAPIKPPAPVVKSAAKATSGKPTGTGPDPYDFGHSPAEAMSVAPKCQQQWADFIASHMAVRKKTPAARTSMTRTGTTPEFWEAYDAVFGDAKDSGTRTAKNVPCTRQITQSFQTAPNAAPWTVEFMLIPPGEFTTSGSKKKIDQPFLLGTYQITREQWAATAIGPDPWNKSWSGTNLPVEGVSWLMCVEFCNRLSEIQGLKSVYSGSGPNYAIDPKADGYRLPTEWEWEYACRAGTATTWWCGRSKEDLKKVAWFDANANSRTHPVDEKKQGNPFGLVGMHGNIWEWCQDDYRFDEKRRVIRGGAWNNECKQLASAFCGEAAPSNNTTFNYGCRVARTVILDP